MKHTVKYYNLLSSDCYCPVLIITQRFKYIYGVCKTGQRLIKSFFFTFQVAAKKLDFKIKEIQMEAGTVEDEVSETSQRTNFTQ